MRGMQHLLYEEDGLWEPEDVRVPVRSVRDDEPPSRTHPDEQSANRLGLETLV